MAAPSSTMPVAAATGSRSRIGDVGVLEYVEETAVGVATLLQQAPVIGDVCTTFLSFKQLVDTAKSNKEALSTLRKLCDVVIKGVLISRTNRPGLPTEGFTKLKELVDRAEKVAKLCNRVGVRGRLKRLVLARKISSDIAAIRSDVQAFCSVNNLALADDTNAKIEQLGIDLDDAMKRFSTAEANRVVTNMEERRRVADLARRVKPPPGAPLIRDWYAKRKEVVSVACGRLGIGCGNAFEVPRMVGLAGPSGAGKSTVASMLVAREDVRAFFHRGILWLQVGKGAKDRLPDLTIRLAGMVYETVLRKTCRPPRKAGPGIDPEDGTAYIQDMLPDSSRRFLVVADDVWEVEVLRELGSAGLWVLYTTRRDTLLPEAPLRLDQVLKEEAEVVLRRATELGDDAPLPDAAYDVMERCEFGVMHLAFVGRWSVVRGRNDEEAWRKAVQQIVRAQKGGEDGENLPWRAAVLRAGLEELACHNRHNQDLYLALAVIPKGLAFPLDVVAVLLYGDGFSATDLDAAGRVASTLERWSILTLGAGGAYRVHDDHTDFVQGCFAAYQNTRLKTLSRWRKYISSVRALTSYSSFWLVKIWEVFERVEGSGVISRPFDAALDSANSSNAEFSQALGRAARFHWRREDWMGAYTKNSQVLEIFQNVAGGRRSVDVASTLHSLGACMHNAGNGEEAKDFFQQALAIRKEMLGNDHLDVARTLHSLGVCLYFLGRTKEAEALHIQAFDIRLAKLGADHSDVVKVLQSLEACSWEASSENADMFQRQALSDVPGRASSNKASTLYSIGPCTYKQKQGAEVELLRRRMLALASRQGGTGVDHRGVTCTLVDLGKRACKAERTEEAREYWRRALAIEGKKLGVDRPDIANTLYKLGKCAYAARRTEEAKEYLKRSLAISEAEMGVNHPDVDILGVHPFSAGTTEEPEEFCRRALTILEEKLGVDHPDVAITSNNLRNREAKAGRKAEAEEPCQRTLTDGEEKLGIDHPEVAATLHKFGSCAYSAGRTEKAEEFGRRALTLLAEKLGVSHPDVSTTLNNLGNCAFSAGRTEEAGEFYRRALTILKEKLGVDHPDVATTLVNLGSCAFEAGRTQEAEEFHRRALTILEDKLGVDHPDVASTLVDLGSCAFSAGRTQEAGELYRRALTILEEELGADHPDVASTLNNVGVCAHAAGRREEAEEFHRRALTIREEKLGVQHPDVADTLSWLGSCAYAAGRTEEAEGFHRRALVIREAELGVDHPNHSDVATTLVNLGSCAYSAGRTEEAEQFYRRAFAIREEKLGVSHPDVARILNGLEMCAQSAGRREEAEELCRRALTIREEKLGVEEPGRGEHSE